MRGTRIPSGKRIVNDSAPINPSDYGEANADHLMFLWDNMGTGDYLEDASIAVRHLKQLFAREQASPNLTLEVLAGVAWFTQNSYQVFAGGNSPTFSAPATNPRIDILTIRNDGTLHVIGGVEAGSPVPPLIPSTDVPIAQVYNVVGQTAIHDNDAQVAGQGYIQYDLRPFVQVAVGSSAMPKIGIVDRVQGSTSASAYSDLVNFVGAGRLRRINAFSAAGSPSVRITIDGGTAYTVNITTPGASPGKDIIVASASGTDIYDTAAASTSGFFLDIFFKSSLLIEINANSAFLSSTVTAEYEHE